MPHLKLEWLTRRHIGDLEIALCVGHGVVPVFPLQHVGGHPGMNAALHLVRHAYFFLNWIRNRSTCRYGWIEPGAYDIRVMSDRITVFDADNLADRDEGDVRQKLAIFLIEYDRIFFR